MPWKAADVETKTKKATTPKLKRMWIAVANGELAQHGNEKRAIMAANGVIAEQVKREKRKRR